MITFKKVSSALLLGTFLVSINMATVHAMEEEFTATSAEEESYWYSRYNLGNLVMRSGMGERYMPEKEMVMKALMMVDADFNKEEFMKGNDDYGDGDHPRPPMNPFMIKSVYKSGNPEYITKFNPDDFATQMWDESKMDKTLTPEAFAYTIQKEVEWAKDFHGEEHFGKITDDFGSYWRFVGMMMNMNAKMQAKYAMGHMDELNKNNSVRGHFALLGAISDLTSMMNDDSFEANLNNRYQDKIAGKMFGDWADTMFTKGYDNLIIPSTIQEYGTAIKSLVWYAKATKKMTNKEAALKKIVDYSNALVSMKGENAGEQAYKIAGLVEAYRVAGVNASETMTASQKFLESFDMDSRLFMGQNTYTIDEVGTIIGALNEIKLFVVEDTEKAEEVFKDFFENVVNMSGLLRSAPPLMIAKSPWEYEGEPENYFRYPGMTPPPMAGGDYGIAPVFVTEVSFKNGKWEVTDANFDSAGAMHASNEMIWLHYDELVGFPELYRLTSEDQELLTEFMQAISQLNTSEKQAVSMKISKMYQKYASNTRIVMILKEVEQYLK